jgi:hypothetical protein
MYVFSIMIQLCRMAARMIHVTRWTGWLRAKWSISIISIIINQYAKIVFHEHHYYCIYGVENPGPSKRDSLIDRGWNGESGKNTELREAIDHVGRISKFFNFRCRSRANLNVHHPEA